MTLWINGTMQTSTITTSNNAGNSGSVTQLGARNNGTDRFWDGEIDEFAIWNRTLTRTEVTQLWNSSNGLTYVPTALPDNSPTVTLIEPEDYFNTTSNTFTLNYSCTDDYNVTNVSLYVDGGLNTTTIWGTSNNTGTISTELSFSEGTHTWNVTCFDNATQSTDGTQRNFEIDSTLPEVNITEPFQHIEYFRGGTNLTINFTTTDTNLETCWYSWDSGATNTTVTCADTNFTTNISSTNNNSVTLYANDTFGNENSFMRDWDYFVFENNRTFNATSYETATERYSIGLSANSSLTTVSLWYNNTEYTTTKDGETYYKVKSLASSDAGTNDLKWEFTYGGDSINSTNTTQEVKEINLYYCPTNSSNYFNVSFKDESDSSVINASIPSSTFEYYIGNGEETETFTYINNTEHFSYPFCLNNSDRNLNVDMRIQYESTGYPQRVYDPDSTLLNGYGNKNYTLYLLSSADGLYVTFQVVNVADQPISNVEVQAERDGNPVSAGTTGADGSVTFWLDPDFIHDFTFTHSSYDTFESSFAPTQSSYTITLGGEDAEDVDYIKGMNITILPKNNTLYNNTNYDFIFTLSSSYWTVSEFGFVMTNSTGSVLVTSSASTNGGTLTETVSTGNHSKIYMDYYYVVNSTYQNFTRTWTIFTTGYTDWSILIFFTDLVTYIDSGLFGLDNFGVALLCFILIFVFTGIMSYKYGFRSPAAIMALVFTLVLFLDIGIGVLPDVMGKHLITVITGLLFLGAFVREIPR